MTHTEDASRNRLAVLSLAALGIVYGDIGTSPLYAVQTVFTADMNFDAPSTIR